MLKKAASEGHWLVFNDCHLLNQWDDEVVTLFNRLFSSVKGWFKIIYLYMLCVYIFYSLFVYL